MPSGEKNIIALQMDGFWKERKRCMRETTKTRFVLIYVYF